MFNDVTVNNCF